MSQITIPEGYKSFLDLKETQIAIKQVKDFFQRELAAELNLKRVSAPLFVSPESGLNDNLNGVERPVSFGVKEQNDAPFEVVQSLAKWKRLALKCYGFKPGEGLYTDMNAIRRDEETDNIHSIFVDQWDWEKIITEENRNETTLRETVKAVYEALRITEKYVANEYSYVDCFLPEEITFVTTQELIDLYPGLTAKERENEILHKHGAVGRRLIADILSDGEKHDGRAPDYDDWQLNGDILVYYPVLD
ncbi:MAG: aspartate--ammonia ligase, partial [Clostridiales bacterium]|nr:aspartate--ammonia ligase [Clostridiales bacterium]